MAAIGVQSRPMAKHDGGLPLFDQFHHSSAGCILVTVEMSIRGVCTLPATEPVAGSRWYVHGETNLICAPAGHAFQNRIC